MSDPAARAPGGASMVWPLERGEIVAVEAVAPATLQKGQADLLIRTPDGGLRFVATLEPGTLLPALSIAGSVIRARATLVLAAGGDRDGLALWAAAWHRAAAALDVSGDGAQGPTEPGHASLALQEAVVDALAVADAETAGHRASTAQDAAFDATLSGYAQLLRNRFRRAGSGTQTPLTAAAARWVEAMGEKPVPLRPNDGESRANYLERFAIANHMRLRVLRLEAGTPLQGDGPVLAFDREDRPCLIKPRLWGAYDLAPADPGARPRRMRKGDWSRLGPQAFALCRTLPGSPLTYRGVLGFGLGFALGDILLLVACGILGTLLALLPPIASQQIINIAVHTADTEFLAQLLTVLAISLMVETAFFVVGQLAQLRAQGKAGLALHAAMVDRLLRLSPADLRSSTTLILATEMETVEKFRRAVVGFAVVALLALISGLASAILVAFISPVAGLIGIGLVLLLFGVTALVGWLQFKVIYEGERMDVIVLAFVYDLVRLVPMARGSRLEKCAFTQWSENFLAFQTRLLRSARISNIVPIFEHLWDALMLATCFAAVAYAGATQTLTAGAAVTFVLALSRLIRAGKDLSHAVMGTAKLLPMAKLARPLLDFQTEPLVTGAAVPHLNGHIDVVDVSFLYGAKRALDHVSVSIRQGEFVSIAGPSGSGKSTLLRVLAGLEQPQMGSVLLDGYDLARVDRRQLTRRLGVVLQNSTLFPGSLYDNIRGVTDIPLDAAWHFAEQAGVADELHALPMGLRTLVSEAGSGLSLGQIQRILIARALAQTPAILILDEATSALDDAAQGKLIDTLARLDLTRIVVAHRPVVWARTERILILRDGVLTADGPPSLVLDHSPHSGPRGSYAGLPTDQLAMCTGSA